MLLIYQISRQLDYILGLQRSLVELIYPTDEIKDKIIMTLYFRDISFRHKTPLMISRIGWCVHLTSFSCFQLSFVLASDAFSTMSAALVDLQ